ncbi:MAG: CAP domain-containing protein [Oscillospiraceae bacterium]|nr:CAP domain-containing protein [Oscillospiraceae bacterium]
MKNVKKASFLVGVLIGALAFGGITATAVGILATPSTVRVVVDGTEVKLEGYNIHNNNFFMLRDNAEAVNYSVVWDGPNNTIYIDTTRGYDPNEQYIPPTATPSPTATPQAEIDVYEYATEVVRYVNIEREKLGLPPLIQSAALTEAAMRKSQDMLDNNYVGHDSPVFGRTESIVNIPGWKYKGENVTNSGYDPESSVKTFMASKGHRENILREGTTHVGIGVAIRWHDYSESPEILWTQLFGTNISE